MKRKSRSLRSAILSVALSASLPVHADELPPRKAGLWEMKDTVANSSIPEITTHQCIEAARQTKSALPAECSGYDIRKIPTGYAVEAVCKSGDRTTTWHSEVTGDLNSHYVATSTTQHQRPSAPVVELTTTTEARWLGDCKPDQKPGDLVMSNGSKVNVEEAEKMGLIPKGPPL